jgi:hypothetical protein
MEELVHVELLRADRPLQELLKGRLIFRSSRRYLPFWAVPSFAQASNLSASWNI